MSEDALFVEDLLEALEDMVNQHCVRMRQGCCIVLDSGALSTNADAMRLLAEHGRMKLLRNHGRMVIGEWTPKNET